MNENTLLPLVLISALNVLFTAVMKVGEFVFVNIESSLFI